MQNNNISSRNSYKQGGTNHSQTGHQLQQSANRQGHQQQPPIVVISPQPHSASKVQPNGISNLQPIPQFITGQHQLNQQMKNHAGVTKLG